MAPRELGLRDHLQKPAHLSCLMLEASAGQWTCTCVARQMQGVFTCSITSLLPQATSCGLAPTLLSFCYLL